MHIENDIMREPTGPHIIIVEMQLIQRLFLPFK